MKMPARQCWARSPNTSFGRVEAEGASSRSFTTFPLTHPASNETLAFGGSPDLASA